MKTINLMMKGSRKPSITRHKSKVVTTERQEEANESTESGDISSSQSKDTKISAFDFFNASGLYKEDSPMYFDELYIGTKDKAMMLSGTVDEFFKSAEEFVRKPGWDLEDFLSEVQT